MGMYVWRDVNLSLKDHQAMRAKACCPYLAVLFVSSYYHHHHHHRLTSSSLAPAASTSALPPVSVIDKMHSHNTAPLAGSSSSLIPLLSLVYDLSQLEKTDKQWSRAVCMQSTITASYRQIRRTCLSAVRHTAYYQASAAA